MAGLKAELERERRALAGARSDIERLEAALAAATHERDRRQEAARLAADGVAELEERVERLRRDGEKELAEAERDRVSVEREQAEALAARERELDEARSAAQTAERELAEAQSRLGAREEHLRTAQIGIESRDRKLEAAEERLGARNAELAAERARLELREEELARTRDSDEKAQSELAAARSKLVDRERELADRERELDVVRERLAEREREFDVAREQLADRERELTAASTLLDAQGEELANARRVAQSGEEELAAVRSRLEVREGHLKTARLGIESRDRKLALADRDLEARDAELERLRVAVADQGRKLAVAEARLEKARFRAERFETSLVSIREGRSYRLMRILWRLRRPFKRAHRDRISASVAADEDPDPSPAAGSSSTPAAAEVRARATAPPPTRDPTDPLRVASVLDEMSAACFEPECELIPLTFDGWREQLDEQRPDLLLVESAWNANGGEWQYRIAKYPRKDLVGLPALRALLDGCRERGIPTAFWNKEDPVHFDRFSEAAALFDHVFTTDARCVERYRELPGGERTVTPLPFAAQPRIHNPIAAVPERSASPCFAGAWYRDRHPDRRRSLEALLDAARPYGLVIYDRSFGGVDKAFGFPERFGPHVLGRLPYERILDVYKSHRVFLNANSVVDSPTMCSRRVFELAACDTAILSTPGAALSALLGDAIVEANDEETAAEALERLLGDDGERARRTRAARRAVFAEHTYADRLATIADTAGLDSSSLRQPPFAIPGSSPNGAGDSYPWRLQLRPGVTLSKEALADLAAAAAFADAGVIGAGPAGNGSPAPEHRYVSDLDPRALLVRRDLAESRGRPSSSADVEVRLREWNDEGVRIYAADADLLVTQGPTGTAAR